MQGRLLQATTQFYVFCIAGRERKAYFTFQRNNRTPCVLWNSLKRSGVQGGHARLTVPDNLSDVQDINALFFHQPRTLFRLIAVCLAPIPVI